ncbi:MAG: OmpA family protein [Bacteroidota bacterium]
MVSTLVSSPLHGQDETPNKYHAISARILAIDNETLNEELSDLNQTFGLELGYRYQFSKLFAAAIPLKFGLLDVGERSNINIVSIDLLGQLYPIGSDARLSPYLLAGYGVTAEGVDDANHQVPVGLGFNYKLGENSFLSLQGEARFNDQASRDNIQIGLGYIYRLAKVDNDADGIVNKEDRCPEEAGPASTGGCPDQDSDGIADADDRCPTEAGVPQLNGCPDADEDGIADFEDQCPQVAGTAEGQGCPDSDGDGVYDHLDACPQEPGRAENGCPLPDRDADGTPDAEDDCPRKPGPPEHFGCPDTDGDGKHDNEDACPLQYAETADGCPPADRDNDGTPNEQDRCPDEFGPPENRGCPEVEAEVERLLEFATQAVQFETGSARLKLESEAVLDDIAEIMRRYPSYSLIISGHTDNVGDDDNNQVLSEDRARACRDYLAEQDISSDRMSYVGYGETRPRRPNDTAAGKRLNRRVEFDLRLL